jgi:hypothetical protein
MWRNSGRFGAGSVSGDYGLGLDEAGRAGPSVVRAGLVVPGFEPMRGSGFDAYGLRRGWGGGDAVHDRCGGLDMDGQPVRALADF